ncbi:hypothetical protein C4K22_4287 [Pseudomonas chlororaphis subsp. aurantiaca]|uniref:Uncharacterized protein n=1 Tax=Pseudomonas chlororaphis TaxID=587753 RepID=A0AAQ1FD30_9PSED|nr:hypothetical protein C4K37_4350 [Pseudomonas chlororaphis subsp. piscium]AZD23345.1 hypothetical protein C4K24_4050 [Pseudomonas chlororaphis subsp. aurantiaca]SDS72728.1 hypothetical protein SAMN04489802_2118 [Pseudomonas chlororaphis]AZC45278.1 hypothetical protein C4K36_4361 [Pseudomonas chlororaphis subsp. piscium]AZC51927.1 hypothetical protein C4K35_4352 [Pseudomonas chlororaphis subsp. piscium]
MKEVKLALLQGATCNLMGVKLPSKPKPVKVAK